MIKLTASETLLLMATRGFPSSTYNNEQYQWSKTKEEFILKDYNVLVDAFITRTRIDSRYITLENINRMLLDLMKKVKPNEIWPLMEAIIGYKYSSTLLNKTQPTINQAVFLELYGRLQAVQMAKKIKKVRTLIYTS